MTPTDLRTAVARAYPDENWDTLCAGFAYLCCRLSGTVRRAYPSATDARLASQIVSTDPATAPAGAFHHWSYWTRLGGVYQDWGHVGMALGGGRCVMTNPEAGEWDWGVCLGETDVASWTARRRGIVTYAGWSHTYGANTATITTPTTAAAEARPLTPQEDDIMLMLTVKTPAGPHLCSLSTGVFRHFIPTDPFDKIMRLSRIQDDWQDVELSELPALLRTYGCDLAIWDVRGDEFVVLDPLDGSVRSGNMWSAVNAARAGVAQVKVTSEQTKAYLAKLTTP
ncbi:MULTISPECIES: hypothetical protein [unclassified Microbacterium]|uniref:hypothetical protein n=1 Tax=unclassified Microbacterium TaxID=2609290 RepID=UPI0030159876